MGIWKLGLSHAMLLVLASSKNSNKQAIGKDMESVSVSESHKLGAGELYILTTNSISGHLLGLKEFACKFEFPENIGPDIWEELLRSAVTLLMCTKDYKKELCRSLNYSARTLCRCKVSNLHTGLTRAGSSYRLTTQEDIDEAAANKCELVSLLANTRKHDDPLPNFIRKYCTLYKCTEMFRDPGFIDSSHEVRKDLLCEMEFPRTAATMEHWVLFMHEMWPKFKKMFSVSNFIRKTPDEYVKSFLDRNACPLTYLLTFDMLIQVVTAHRRENENWEKSKRYRIVVECISALVSYILKDFDTLDVSAKIFLLANIKKTTQYSIKDETEIYAEVSKALEELMEGTQNFSKEIELNKGMSKGIIMAEVSIFTVEDVEMVLRDMVYEPWLHRET